MWRRIGQLSLMALILGGLGCQHPKPLATTKQPPDPLLTSKKPVEGKPTSYTPSTSWREPQPPSVPARDFVVQQPKLGLPVTAEEAGVSIGKPRWQPDRP